jgi:hypothetical protein
MAIPNEKLQQVSPSHDDSQSNNVHYRLNDHLNSNHHPNTRLIPHPPPSPHHEPPSPPLLPHLDFFNANISKKKTNKQTNRHLPRLIFFP